MRPGQRVDEASRLTKLGRHDEATKVLRGCALSSYTPSQWLRVGPTLAEHDPGPELDAQLNELWFEIDLSDLGIYQLRRLRRWIDNCGLAPDVRAKRTARIDQHITKFGSPSMTPGERVDEASRLTKLGRHDEATKVLRGCALSSYTPSQWLRVGPTLAEHDPGPELDAQLNELWSKIDLLKLGIYQLRRLRRWIDNCGLASDVRAKRAAQIDEVSNALKTQSDSALRLTNLLEQSLKEDDLEQLLVLMAQVEAEGFMAPLKVGERLSVLVTDIDNGTTGGRARLQKACEVALHSHPDSLYLTHLDSMLRSFLGNYRKAAAELEAHIGVIGQADAATLSTVARLRECWTVVDQIAFDAADWSGEDGDSSRSVGGEPHDKGAVAQLATDDQSEDPEAPIFTERLLQRRQFDEFVASSQRNFGRVTSLHARLQAIKKLTALGLRRVPDYSLSYAAAGQHFTEVVPAIYQLLENLASKPKAAPRAKDIASLCLALRLARQLNHFDTAERIIAAFEALARKPRTGTALWQACSAVAEDPEYRALATDMMKRVSDAKPETEADIRHFFRWAQLTSSWAEADILYSRVPISLARSQSCLQFVEVLQRQSRFDEACALARRIHGFMLSDPAKLRPMPHYRACIRVGELIFISRAAELLSEVPQPTDPVGIILVMARTLIHLRSYPLMALREFKARGWAVIPMVEGLLPREPTGNHEIDAMIGAITKNAVLQPWLSTSMPETVAFEAAVDQGKLRWGAIDLSHVLWEDAAINRRRYSISWHCPVLQQQLNSLVTWSRSMARLLTHAHQLNRQHGLKVGTISLFNSRLPDALPRFFCEREGTPDSFFHVLAANGYQNYFTNFSTNISQRFVLRNTTRHIEARSASFPLPQNFARFVEANSHLGSELLSRHLAITQLRRSTGGQKSLPPEAQEVDRFIAYWRATGGKVACAFGKVVCDSSVPVDGGPCHSNMKDWINHCVRSVQGSETLLLIKPHPHELSNLIATFPTEFFTELIDEPLGSNVIVLGHRWFDMADMESRIDLGLIYNGTTTVELALMGIPAVLAGHYAPIDYPIGQCIPKSREDFEAILRFQTPPIVVPDLRERAALWIEYMKSDDFTLPYRYHSRPVTNRKISPPYWFDEDLDALGPTRQCPIAARLVDRALGLAAEPWGMLDMHASSPSGDQQRSSGRREST